MFRLSWKGFILLLPWLLHNLCLIVSYRVRVKRNINALCLAEASQYWCCR